MWFIRIFTASSIWAGTRRREAAAGLLLATGHRHPLVAKSSWGGSVCLAAAGRERSQQVGVLLPPHPLLLVPVALLEPAAAHGSSPGSPIPALPGSLEGSQDSEWCRGLGSGCTFLLDGNSALGLGQHRTGCVGREEQDVVPWPQNTQGCSCRRGPRALRCGSFPSPGESRMWPGMPCAPPHHTSGLQNHGFISHPIPSRG